jgi:hypothetical protein
LIAHLHKAQHHEKLGKMSNEALKAIIQDLWNNNGHGGTFEDTQSNMSKGGLVSKNGHMIVLCFSQKLAEPKIYQI